jgi:hypothetical protein
LSRDQAVQRLRQHLREALEQDDVQIVTSLVSELADYAPKEALEDIKAAYERGIVEPFMIGLEDVERSIAEGETRLREVFQRLRPAGIDDVLEELGKWNSFQEKPAERRAVPPPSAPSTTAARTLLGRAPSPLFPEPPRARVGRNDPCPCGSGKKFKKCCGANK